MPRPKIKSEPRRPQTTNVNLSGATITVGGSKFEPESIRVLEALAKAMEADALAAQRRGDTALKIAEVFRSGSKAVMNINGDLTIGED